MTASRGRLFSKYATLIIALVGGVLLVSGAVGLYFSYGETRAQLVALQFEKAQGAATRIEQYVLDIEHQLSWTALPRVDSSGDPMEQRRIEYLKLLRQAPAITEVTWIDGAGREQLRVSRLSMDTIGAGPDLSNDPKFSGARGGKTRYGEVYFRKGTEPYMTISRPAGPGGGVTAAEVNLKFVWDVVSRIKIGKAGLAYVVDAGGTLIAHPDISLVLKKSDLSALPQVAARTRQQDGEPPTARDLNGDEVLAAHALIPTLDWTVFVESPRAEAYAPLYASLLRTGLLLLAGLLVATAASFYLAGALVRPIRALQEGAAQIGSGELEHRIDVKTGDELEGLAEQFNKMGADLKESYAGLERNVEARTAELREALDRQTATSEILRVISESPADVQPVLDAVSQRAGLLCHAQGSRVWLPDGEVLRAMTGYTLPGAVEVGRGETLPLRRTSVIAHAFLERRIVHVDDVAALIDTEYPDSGPIQRRHGFRTVLAVPMLREGVAVGAIGLLRRDVKPFSASEIDLVQTFADQAVIAIENVRLFNEIQEALEQQTATAEVVKMLSRSVFQLQPVLEALIENACRVCRARKGLVLIGDGDEYRLAVNHGATLDEIKVMLRMYLSAAGGGSDGSTRFLMSGDDFKQGTVVGRMVLSEQVVHERDMQRSPIDAPRDMALRTMLGVPLLFEQRPIGVVAMWRDEVMPFSVREIELVKTFADQAVIAIQNARLFDEIQAKSHELERANRHKSEFLANMSHELRTPLNAIIGFSEVLAEQMFGDVNAKQLEYLQDIHSSGHHLLTLINDILDLSKIEAGRMELDLSRVNLPMLLDNTTTLVRERALRQGLTLTLEIDDAVGDWVVDQRKLKQVVINLLSNAVKFTPSGGRVTLRARSLDRAVEIAVCDTGVGIAADQQALVFEEFRQAGGDYLRKTEGTGLGLALAKRFVELHGGTMRLDSVVGQGSTFAFILPERELEAAT